MPAWILPVLLTAHAATSGAVSDFVKDLRKAGSRTEASERVEWYSRAIKAWGPAEDMVLLGQCHFGRGEALVEILQFEQAVPDLTKAMELDPGNAKAYLLRGRSRLALNKVSDAAQDLMEYVGRNPSDIEGALLLGDANLRLGRSDSAFKAFALAQQANPGDGRGWLGEGRFWMARKDWTRAEKVLDTADEKGRHQLPEALAERAACRVALGRLEDARRDYTNALLLHSNALNDLQRSRRHPAEIAAQQEKMSRALFGRGRLNEFLVRHAEALSDYREACAFGHQEACARADVLGARQETQPKKSTYPEQVPIPPQPPAPRDPRRRRAPAPDNDAGDRIYGG